MNNGLALAHFFGGAGDVASGKIIVGTQGNGVLTYTPAAGPNGWTIMAHDNSGTGTADGSDVAIDSTDANYLYGSFARWLHPSSSSRSSCCSPLRPPPPGCRMASASARLRACSSRIFDSIVSSATSR